MIIKHYCELHLSSRELLNERNWLECEHDNIQQWYLIILLIILGPEVSPVRQKLEAMQSRLGSNTRNDLLGQKIVWFECVRQITKFLHFSSLLSFLCILDDVSHLKNIGKLLHHDHAIGNKCVLITAEAGCLFNRWSKV